MTTDAENKVIDVEEAVYFLMTANRAEINKDAQVFKWQRNGTVVANSMTVNSELNVFVTIDGREQAFTGDEAKRLLAISSAS